MKNNTRSSTTQLCSCCLLCVMAIALMGCRESPPVMTLAELIDLKGHPILVISSFEILEKEDGFKRLTIYGVAALPGALANERGELEEHWLLFTDDFYFLREVEVHFSSMKSNPHLDSSIFLSHSSSGTKFDIAKMAPDGRVSEVVDCRANLVKLVNEIRRDSTSLE